MHLVSWDLSKIMQYLCLSSVPIIVFIEHLMSHGLVGADKTRVYLSNRLLFCLSTTYSCIPFMSSPSRSGLPSTMKSIANMMKMNKKSRTDAYDTIGLTSNSRPECGSSLTVASNEVVLNGEELIDQTLHSQDPNLLQQTEGLQPSITTPVCVDKLQEREYNSYSHKCQDFQVW